MACVWRVGRAVVLVLMLAGCGGGGKTVVPDDPECHNNTLSVGFKTPPGYTASMDFSTTSNCFAPATYSTKASTTVLAGPPFTGDPSQPDPTLKVWLYLSWQFDTLQYLAALPSVSTTVPAVAVVPGRVFHLAYDTNDIAPPFVWNTQKYGTATAGPGNSVGFGEDDSAILSIEPNAFYQVALYSTGP